MKKYIVLQKKQRYKKSIRNKYFLRENNHHHHHHRPARMDFPDSLSLSLSLSLSRPPLPAGLFDYILCLYRTVVDKFLQVVQHLLVRVKGSIGDRR